VVDGDLHLKLDANDYSDIRDSIEQICKECPGEYWRALEDESIERRYPEQFVRALEEAGFLSPCISETYGGVDLPLSGAAAIAGALHEFGCNSQSFITQVFLSKILQDVGTGDQKNTYLRSIASAQARLQSLVSPPDVSDTAPMITASKTDNGFVLNGERRWVFNVSGSGLLIVAADSSPHDGDVSLFIVDPSQNEAGFSATPIDAMNNCSAATIEFTEFEVPADCLLGELGQGQDYLNDASPVENILLAAASYGDAMFFSRRGVDYANERVVFGNKIGSYQGIQFPLAKAHVEAEGAFVALQKATALYESGRDARGASHLARHLAVEAAWGTAEAAFTTHGGFAFAREYDIERKWREVRAMRNTTAAAETGLAYVARQVLNLPMR
jgi:acyl-CoA dehydrogenase